MISRLVHGWTDTGQIYHDTAQPWGQHRFNIMIIFTDIGIAMIKIKRTLDCRILIMGILVCLVRWIIQTEMPF